MGLLNPAAQMDGDVFVMAAKKYGLANDNATLNKIVDLVNAGVDVDSAAKQVSQKKGKFQVGLLA